MSLLRLTSVAAAGGSIGALARWALSLPVDGTGTLAITLAINVVGSAVLAALPSIAAVRRSSWLPTFLGTGVIGGFTTMSAAAVLPLIRLHTSPAAVYVIATLAASLGVARLVDRAVSSTARDGA